MNQLLIELKARNLIQQSTDLHELSVLLDQNRGSVYCGFDPTADSLHVGHLLPILLLRRFQLAGIAPIALIGGATGLIGDPSFKSNDRVLQSPEQLTVWVEKIRNQLASFLAFDGKAAAKVVNNLEWIGPLDTLHFLRDIGKHFSVNAMMNKESVKQRIHREGEGISFTEFAYSLLQSYDFVQLNFHYDCILQVGGSDQWGNITAGVELVRRLNQANVHALTLPLLVKADGSKFGKTESGAVWLDAKKTSPYQFYQFWLKVPDTNVYRYLRMFSFLSLEEIEAIRHQDQHSEHKPQAQQILAEEMTCLIHGKEALVAAKRISYSLFTAGYDTLTEKDFTDLALDGLPHFAVRNGMSLIEALTISGLAKSNNEARRFIAQHAVLLNGTLVKDHERLLSQDDQRYGKYAILQRGKRSHVLLVWR